MTFNMTFFPIVSGTQDVKTFIWSGHLSGAQWLKDGLKIDTTLGLFFMQTIL